MSNEEHLIILRRGKDAWNKWRKENSNIRPILTRANLIGADLNGADLSGTNPQRTARFGILQDRRQPELLSVLRLVEDEVAQGLVAGFCMACPESTETAMADLREIGPSFFFAPPGQGAAPRPLRPEGTMLSFTAYRDFAARFFSR